MSGKKYDPSQYETVKERKAKFYTDHPDGRIIAKLENTEHMDYVIVNAAVYTCKEDQANQLPKGTGYALEVRDKELSISNYGKQYESVNYTSWLENCEESAIGRALDNAGYSGNRKCSLEEMQKTERNAKAISSRTTTVKSATNQTDFYTSFKFASGKQAGKSFPEINDTGWLSWLSDNGKTDDMKKAAVRRLAELKKPAPITIEEMGMPVQESEFDFGDNAGKA